MTAKNDPSFFGGSGSTEKPVIGLRNWRIDSLFRLTGVVYKDSVWVPGENNAVCRRIPRAGYAAGGYTLTIQVAANWAGHTSTAPVLPADHDMDDCLHGFYAYYDGSRDYHERGDVTGVIQGYGETVVGTKGFRCMKARILAVKFSGSIPEMVRHRISDHYPEVAVFKSLDHMLAEYPTDVGGLEYRPENDTDFWTKEA